MKFTKDQIIAFIFGLGASITIRVVGILAISDIIAIVSFPYILIQKNNYTEKKFKLLIILLLFWMLSTIISDIYNHTPTIDAVKGFFTLVPFLTCLFFAFWMLKKDYQLMIPFLWGYAISILIGAGFEVDQFFSEAISKARLGGVAEFEQYQLKISTWILNAFITGAFAITYYKKFPKITITIIFISSGIYLLIGSRSIFLINFLSGIILVYFFFKYSSVSGISSSYNVKPRWQLLQISVLILFSIITTMGLYQISVSQGFLGEEELRKYEYQKSAEIGILSGRYEIVSALLAIYDSPILGHGSYARDFNNYGLSAALITGLPLESLVELSSESINYIPTHSHLWQAWVNNGFVGGLFWLYVLIGILIAFIKTYLFKYPDYLAYLTVTLLMTFWNVLFSPFSQKPFLAMTLVFLIVLMSKSDENSIKL